MCLNEWVSASVDVVSKVPQVTVLGSLLFILYTSELFHVVGDYIVDYADDTTICAINCSQTALASSSDRIAESGFGSNQLLVFEVAHEAEL